ncbi:MAG: 4-(cytidine 5'-diphospho)-2-C-methyl-D-erythritol kinase [Parvibaculaceae bacterium]
MTGGVVAVAEFAPAKINLALHVVGRRPDGYHLLDSLVVFADAGDRVRATAAEGLSLAIAGPRAPGLEVKGNLVLKAAEALREAAARQGLGAALVLEKHLPVASGIGGGSSDAAAALKVLDRLWGLGLGAERLAEIGLKLGADVPVCVHSTSARMRGVGEKIESVELPRVSLVLANPGRPLSTAAVFERLARRDNTPMEAVPALRTAEELAAWLARCRNDLEAPAREAEPAVGTTLDALARETDCLLARMSGSGATCFGLFAETAKAARAAGRLAEMHPDWWVVAARTL